MYQNYRPTGMFSFPLVVKNLLIINAICFALHLLMISADKLDINTIFGLYNPGSEKFRPYQLITHIFMHADIEHIFLNMFSLCVFVSKLVTGLGAAALHLGVNYYELMHVKQVIATFMANPDYDGFYGLIKEFSEQFNDANVSSFMAEWSKDKTNPIYIEEAQKIASELKTEIVSSGYVVGASGAVYGLVLGFAMLFPNTEMILMFFPVPIKAKYIAIGMGALELYSGFQKNPGDNVAHFAHLGGMLFGYLLILYWNKTNRRSLY